MFRPIMPRKLFLGTVLGPPPEQVNGAVPTWPAPRLAAQVWSRLRQVGRRRGMGCHHVRRADVRIQWVGATLTRSQLARVSKGLVGRES